MADDARTTSERPALAAWCDAVALMSCMLLAGVYVRTEILDADEAIFASIGRRAAVTGLPVYAAGWDHKPPGIFILYRWLYAPWPSSGLLGPHIASAVVWVVTAWCLGQVARKVFGWRAFAPTVVTYALLRSFGGWKAGAANTESFLQLPLVVGLTLLVCDGSARLRLALGGACITLATLLKFPAALFGPAAVCAVACVRGWRSARDAAVWGALGAVAVAGVEWGRVLSGGDAQGWWICNVTANSLYMQSDTGGAGLAARGIWDEFVRLPAPWCLAAIGIAGVASGAAPTATGTPMRRPALALAALILVACGVTVASMGGRFYRHYWWMAYPMLSVLAGAGVATLLGSGRSGPATWARRATLVVIAASWLPQQYVDKRRMLATPPSEAYAAASNREAVRAIRNWCPEDRTVFIWGVAPELYVLSQRVPGTRIVTCKFLTGSLRGDIETGSAAPIHDLVPQAWPAFLADVAEYRPAVIVDTSPGGRSRWDLFPPESFPALTRLLADQYEPVPGVHGGCRLFVRR